MRQRHRVETVCTPSVGVVLHRVTPCPHTKTKTKTLDRDLRPEEIANAEIVTNVAWLGKDEPSTNGSAPPPKPSRYTICRQRERDGLIVLKTVHDEAHLTSLLISAGELPRNQADDKQAIEKALERYIASGKAAEFDV